MGASLSERWVGKAKANKFKNDREIIVGSVREYQPSQGDLRRVKYLI